MRFATLRILGLLCAVAPIRARASLIAQSTRAPGRVVERHDFTDPEGELLGFYLAVVTFSPIGERATAPPWSVDVGGEASYVPRLNADQRSAGRTKLESTNLAPVLPRPRVALWLPGGLAVEGSWTPPVRVFGARSSLIAGALSAPLVRLGGARIAARVSYVGGQVSGAITCYRGMAAGDLSLRDYWFHICHSRESDDRFEPSQWGYEVIGNWLGTGAVTANVGLGVEREHTKFDVGVLNADGSRDLDHPILELRAARGYGVAGATWRVSRVVRVSSEMFYAPGSLLTVRALARVRVHAP